MYLKFSIFDSIEAGVSKRLEVPYRAGFFSVVSFVKMFVYFLVF